MIKDYEKAEVIKDAEDKLDLINTNIVYSKGVDSLGNITDIKVSIPILMTGFLNVDLVEVQDSTVRSMVLLPIESLTSEDRILYDSNTELAKALVLKSYTNITSEFLQRVPKYSIKEDFLLERNRVEIMQNVLRRVTEVQSLDAERIPLLNSITDAIVKAFEAVASYTDPNAPNTPSMMNLKLTPDLIQAIGDASQQFSEKDEEMRTLLEELSKEVKIFIKGEET